MKKLPSTKIKAPITKRTVNTICIFAFNRARTEVNGTSRTSAMKIDIVNNNPPIISQMQLSSSNISLILSKIIL